MPLLTDHHTVHAVDLRGAGGSTAPASGYDAQTLAGDLAGLLEALGTGPVHLVRHDIGGWVAYALARTRPDLVRTVVVMETLLPGIDPPDAPVPDVALWHVGFHLAPDLPEALVQGRQATYFRHFLDTGTTRPDVITDEDVAHCAAAYADDAHLRAAFEVYRAMPRTAEQNAAQTGPIDVPLLLVGGEHCFGPVMPSLARHLQDTHGWARVRATVLPGLRHYLADEAPELVADLLLEHARRG